MTSPNGRVPWEVHRRGLRGGESILDYSLTMTLGASASLDSAMDTIWLQLYGHGWVQCLIGAVAALVGSSLISQVIHKALHLESKVLIVTVTPGKRALSLRLKTILSPTYYIPSA